MIRRPNQNDIEELKRLWISISYWKKKLGMSFDELQFRTKFSPDSLARGLKGEPVPVRHALRDFFEAFGLQSGRIKSFEDTPDSLTDKEIEDALNSRAEQTDDDDDDNNTKDQT